MKKIHSVILVLSTLMITTPALAGGHFPDSDPAASPPKTEATLNGDLQARLRNAGAAMNSGANRDSARDSTPKNEGEVRGDDRNIRVVRVNETRPVVASPSDIRSQAHADIGQERQEIADIRAQRREDLRNAREQNRALRKLGRAEAKLGRAQSDISEAQARLDAAKPRTESMGSRYEVRGNASGRYDRSDRDDRGGSRDSGGRDSGPSDNHYRFTVIEDGAGSHYRPENDRVISRGCYVCEVRGQVSGRDDVVRQPTSSIVYIQPALTYNWREYSNVTVDPRWTLVGRTITTIDADGKTMIVREGSDTAQTEEERIRLALLKKKKLERDATTYDDAQGKPDPSSTDGTIAKTEKSVLQKMSHSCDQWKKLSTVEKATVAKTKASNPCKSYYTALDNNLAVAGLDDSSKKATELNKGETDGNSRRQSSEVKKTVASGDGMTIDLGDSTEPNSTASSSRAL